MGQSSSLHKYYYHQFDVVPGSEEHNSSSFYPHPERRRHETGETYSPVAPLLLLLFFIILSAIAILFYLWRKHGYPPMSLVCAHFPEIKRPPVPAIVTSFFERLSSVLSPFTLPFSRFSNEHSNSNSSRNRPPTFGDGGFVSRTRPVTENVDAVWPTKTRLSVPLPVSGQTNNSDPLDIITIPPLALPMVNGYSNQAYGVVDVQTQAQVQVQSGVGSGNELTFDKKPNGNGRAMIQVDACVNSVNAVNAETEHKENSCEEPVYAAIEVSNDYETLQDLKPFSGQ